MGFQFLKATFMGWKQKLESRANDPIKNKTHWFEALRNGDIKNTNKQSHPNTNKKDERSI